MRRADKLTAFMSRLSRTSRPLQAYNGGCFTIIIIIIIIIIIVIIIIIESAR